MNFAIHFHLHLWLDDFLHASDIWVSIQNPDFDEAICFPIGASFGIVFITLFFSIFRQLAELEDDFDAFLNDHQPEVSNRVGEGTLSADVHEIRTDSDKAGIDVIVTIGIWLKFNTTGIEHQDVQVSKNCPLYILRHQNWNIPIEFRIVLRNGSGAGRDVRFHTFDEFNPNSAETQSERV